VNSASKTRPNLLAREKLPPQPLQKRSTEKRAQLEAAGLALFGEKGFEATSVDEIAWRARLAVGTFYQHYHSKRQLLRALMDQLLERLSQLDFRPQGSGDLRSGLRQVLGRAFDADLKYLGAYRAWQEAVLSDPDLARQQKQIRAWTTARVITVFQLLQKQPSARRGVDIPGLARAMDSFFWTLLAQAVSMPKADLHRQIDAATHLIYHALFTDTAHIKRRRNSSDIVSGPARS
jgi:AcrR family transcriptional regulator